MQNPNTPKLSAANDVRNIDDLIKEIEQENCVPGWIRHNRPLMWPRPQSAFKPAHWKYAHIRPVLIAAGRVIGTDLAERRNFILKNPIAGNDFATTRTLVGAYQSILPGERARSHRHSPHALRVILESRGSYSIVNGKKHLMETGDIVLTPGNYWHGHGHEGAEQAFWFDCLDIPLVQLLEPMSAEEHPENWESSVQDEPDSAMRFPWADTERKLKEQASATTVDQQKHFGVTVELDAPSMPTIGIKVHHLETEWIGQAYKHNASSILVVLRGKGRTEIDSQAFDWNFGDVIAAPMGTRIKHECDEDSVVVELTDEKLMRYCKFYQHEDCAE